MENKRHFFLYVCLFFLNSCRDQPEKYYGYLEGRYAYLSCKLNGVVTDIFVKRGQTVTVGQPLFQIDDADEQINISILTRKIEKAQSNLVYAKESLEIQKTNLHRKNVLNKAKQVADTDVDQARNKFDEAQNKFDVAQKALNEAEANCRLEQLNQSRKFIKAPLAGYIADEFYSLGEFVTAGSPVLSLLPETQVNAVFFVSTKKVQKFKRGMTVAISCDNCRSGLQGKICYIQSSPEFTPPNIYSSNFQEELVFRLEAELSGKDPSFLNVGQPIEVRLE